MDGKMMTEDGKNVPPLPDRIHDRDVRISSSELLSLLGRFHEKLNALFDEMRTIPESTARQKAGNSRSKRHAFGEPALRLPSDVASEQR